MRTLSISKLLIFLLVFTLSGMMVFAQKSKSKTKPKAPVKAKSIIFGVVNDGASLEPIAYVENGKLVEAANGMSDEKILTAFAKSFYQPKTTYNLVFGGKNDGKVTVSKSNVDSDCAKNMAEITVQPGKAKIKGFVMALATNGTLKPGPGVRRMPTFPERTEIEALVRAEFENQKITSEVVKNLRYHNLTAIDVDNDGKAEMVGSFYVEPAATERAKLFFIAEKNSSGKYAFTHREYELTKESDVMNSEIKALDEGIYHELFLDSYDYDGDGVGEIFTLTQGFESNGFTAYKREAGKWVKSFEGSNYHCGY